MKYYEKRNGDPNKLAYAKWLILHHQKAEWKLVQDVLKDITKTADKISAARGFVALYLANLRLEETQQAAKYWFDVSDEWVKSHPDQTYHASILLKKLDSWYLYPHDEITLSGTAAMEAMRELTRLEGRAVQERRNAKVVIELLNRLAADGENCVELLVEYLDLKKSPAEPSPFTFDDEMADIMGIGEDEFKAMCLRAEIIE